MIDDPVCHQKVFEQITRARPANPPLRDAADLVFIRYILGEESGKDVAQGLITVLAQSQEDGSGWPGTWHSFGMALRALNMLKLQPPKPFSFMDRVDENFLVQLTLDLDWTTPWHSSISVLHAATPVILRGDGDFSRFFQVLEEYQAENGGWGEHPDPHHQMAGAFHFLPFYRAAGRRFPRLEALARLVLALPIHGVGFGTMDMMAVLLFAMERGAIPPDECERFFREVENVVRRCPLPEKRHDLLAYVQILAHLSRYAGNKAARDAWDPELWRLP